MRNISRPFAVAVAFLALAAGCANDGTSNDAEAATTTMQATVAAPAGVRAVSPDDAAAIHADPPPGLVVLDVRTPEEFAEGHLESAIMIDFYREDFPERLAELDPDQPYLLYCRSGNRSGQTRSIMESLGFTDVADINGGILAWSGAGYPVVAP